MSESFDDTDHGTDSQGCEEALVLEGLDDIVFGVLGFGLVVDFVLFDVLGGGLDFLDVVFGRIVTVAVASEHVVGDRAKKLDWGEHVRGVEEDGEGQRAGCGSDGPESAVLARERWVLVGKDTYLGLERTSQTVSPEVRPLCISATTSRA